MWKRSTQDLARVTLSPLRGIPQVGKVIASKQELLHFLDRHVFDPILHATPDRYNSKKLKDVQDRTQSEKHRFITTATQRRSSRTISATFIPQPRSA
jgi:hypothetical protein